MKSNKDAFALYQLVNVAGREGYQMQLVNEKGESFGGSKV